MPLQPPRAYPAGSVMTRCWCDKAKLDGQFQKARTGISATSSRPKQVFSWPTPLTPATLSQQSAKLKSQSLKSDAVTQVRKLPGRCVLLLLIFLVLISQPVMSKPWSNMQPDHVIFRSRICQPVPTPDLQKRWSTHNDNSRMASDTAAAKRTHGSTIEDPGNVGYQGDEPRIGLVVDGADFIEDAEDWNPDDEVWVDAREEDIYTDNRMIEEIGDNEIVERRTWVPRKRILNRRVPNRVSRRKSYRKSKNDVKDNGLGDEPDSKRQTVFSDSYSYMRRRRRRSLEDAEPSSRSNNQDWDNPSVEEDMEENVNIDDYDFEEDDADSDSKDKKSADNIQLRLFLRGKDKKTRKLLKKKLRQKARNLSKPPPWECKFIQGHKRMRKGIFPDILLDGRCDTVKCFYRLYNCEPIKYAVKLLQRDPNKCNPLPSTSNLTVYEERWDLVQYHVTVGCNCASPSVKSGKTKNRKGD